MSRCSVVVENQQELAFAQLGEPVADLTGQCLWLVAHSRLSEPLSLHFAVVLQELPWSQDDSPASQSLPVVLWPLFVAGHFLPSGLLVSWLPGEKYLVWEYPLPQHVPH